MKSNRQITIAEARCDEDLQLIQDDYIKSNSIEIIPFAVNTSFIELCNTVKRDREGYWKNPVFLYSSLHHSQLGIKNLCNKVYSFIKKNADLANTDVLSVNASLEGEYIVVNCLVRSYNSTKVNFKGLYKYLGEISSTPVTSESKQVKGRLVIPDEVKNFSFSDEQVAQHALSLSSQEQAYQNATKDVPFLNAIEKYEPKKLYSPMENTPLVYDLQTFDRQITTMCDYELFIKTFRKAMRYANTIENDSYLKVVQGTLEEDVFMDMLRKYIVKEYVQNKNYGFPMEDLQTLMNKLHRALFELYIIQDMIDDPDVSDINITAPNCIRCRVKGNTYKSNVSFLDLNDYIRFINMVVIRNRVNTKLPSQTFTDPRDDDYILRFSLTVDYVNSVDWPYLHIRKIPRTKLLGDDLIRVGMMDEKIRDYVIDCARDKTNGGIVICGSPGSGKTVFLNWLLEQGYEDSASILCIQENDELFAQDREGIMFEHVVTNPIAGQQAVSLDRLGQLALVAGANVFIIGEAKGPEICSAMTLGNSGCRTALTLHTNSAEEAPDKMADLAMRGIFNNYEQAKRAVKSFKTFIFLRDFKVQEISELIRFNEETKDFDFKPIYRRPVEGAADTIPSVHTPKNK